jgi:SAM-dependent methyltransferase
MNKNVREYYKKTGWAVNDKGQFVDTLVNENLQIASERYNSKTRRRVLLELIDQPVCEYGRILDCASGPVQYPEYVEYSAGYKQRYCVDFSAEALKHAEANLTKAGQNDCRFICNDFFEEPFEEGFFDSAISLHTLYHIDKTRQEDFVRKLLECVKPGMKVVIVYSNPFSFRASLALPVDVAISLGRFVKRSIFRMKAAENTFYFGRHPIGWWRRFSDSGKVEIKSYRFLTPAMEKMLIPDNRIGSFIYNMLFKFESTSLSKYFSDYYMVIIRKNKNTVDCEP